MWQTWQRSSAGFVSLILLGASWIAPSTALAAAGPWTYTIGPADTPTVIDKPNTTAKVDVDEREIILGAGGGANIVSFWPDGSPDFVVAATGEVKHFSWTGSGYQENLLAKITVPTNPVAVGTVLPMPDVVVATESGIEHWSFTGASWVRNPAMEVAGITGITSMGVREGGDAAVLAEGVIHYYQFAGSTMVENPFLVPSASFTNPMALALKPGTHEMAVVEQDRVRFFAFTGTDMAEITPLAITGITDAKAVVYGSGGDVAVVAGQEVRHYSLAGSSLVYNSALSVGAPTLTAPSAVAIRPGSLDRLIVDGEEIRYFAWTGSELVEDPARKVTVPGLASFGAYTKESVVLSIATTADVPSDRVRVRALHTMEPNTRVTWSVSADGGTTWTTAWRVSADDTGVSLCEATTDNGSTWTSLGSADACFEDRPELWAEVTPGTEVRWQAQLETTDPEMTPHIKAATPGADAVIWEVDAKPNPPTPDDTLLPPPGTCYPVSTPQFAWKFTDPDLDDYQTGFQVQIKRADDADWDSPIYDSDWIMAGTEQYTLPAYTNPTISSPLWSSGTYRYQWRVRTQDKALQASEWSVDIDFCVTAIERLRVVDIASPVDGGPAPVVDDPATHVVVWPNQDPLTLPRAKAGARVRVRADVIGPAMDIPPGFPQFPYQDRDGLTRFAHIAETTPTWLYPKGTTEVNQWDIDIWTEASQAVVPSGTIVSADLAADMGAYGTARWVEIAPFTSGLYVTHGSIYSDWTVILEGSDQ